MDLRKRSWSSGENHPCFFCGTQKKGSMDMTMKKLIIYVLLIAVMALVLYGITTNGFGPLVERAGAQFDEVMLLIGFGDDGGSEGDCLKPFPEEIKGAGNGVVTICKTYCKVDMDGGEGIYSVRSDNLDKLYSYETYYKVRMFAGNGWTEQILYFRWNDVLGFWEWSYLKDGWALVSTTSYKTAVKHYNIRANDRFKKEYLSFLETKDKVSGHGFFKGKIATQDDDKNEVKAIKDWVDITQELVEVSDAKINELNSWRDIRASISNITDTLKIPTTLYLTLKCSNVVSFTKDGFMIQCGNLYYFFDGTSLYLGKRTAHEVPGYAPIVDYELEKAGTSGDESKLLSKFKELVKELKYEGGPMFLIKDGLNILLGSGNYAVDGVGDFYVKNSSGWQKVPGGSLDKNNIAKKKELKLIYNFLKTKC